MKQPEQTIEHPVDVSDVATMREAVVDHRSDRIGKGGRRQRRGDQGRQREGEVAGVADHRPPHHLQAGEPPARRRGGGGGVGHRVPTSSAAGEAQCCGRRDLRYGCGNSAAGMGPR